MFRPFGSSTTAAGSAFGGASIPPSPQQPTLGSSSFFGGGPTVPAFTSPHVSFQPHKDSENGVSVTIHSISAMPNYIGKSFEELRLEDYAVGRKGRTSAFPPSSSSNYMSAPATSAPFGGQPPSTSMFGGNTGPSSFGNQYGGGASSMTMTGTNTGGIFGQPQQQQQTGRSMFGGQPQPTSSFGAGGAFGQPNPTSSFGLGGNTTGNSIFGQPNTSIAAPSAGLGFGLGSSTNTTAGTRRGVGT